MKAIPIFIIMLSLVAATGCKYKKESQALHVRVGNLTDSIRTCDSTMNEYILLFNNVKSRLDSTLERKSEEKTATVRELSSMLDKTVTDINTLLKKEKERYESMRRMYSASSSKAKKYSEEINNMQRLIESRDSVINDLNSRISSLKRTGDENMERISDLTRNNSLKDSRIDSLKGELNTAYFIAGNAKDLKDKNIIIKTGGFLSLLGRVNAISPGIQVSMMEKIDIREKKTFTIDSQLSRIDIVSFHPSGSYKLSSLNNNSTQLEVTDPGQFWSISRYLVIAF